MAALPPEDTPIYHALVKEYASKEAYAEHFEEKEQENSASSV